MTDPHPAGLDLPHVGITSIPGQKVAVFAIQIVRGNPACDKTVYDYNVYIYNVYFFFPLAHGNEVRCGFATSNSFNPDR